MKPIVPKKNINPTETADNLEASFQKAFIPTSEPNKVEVERKPAPDVVEKTVRKPQTGSKTIRNTEGVVSPKKKEKNSIITTKRDGVNRVTLDIPNELFTQIEAHKEATGQTMKFLMVSLLKRFFAENEEAK
jgi:hypothetical protein